MSKYKNVSAQCPTCKKIINMSFDKDLDHRFTWCWRCEEAVIWTEVKSNEEITEEITEETTEEITERDNLEAKVKELEKEVNIVKKRFCFGYATKIEKELKEKDDKIKELESLILNKPLDRFSSNIIMSVLSNIVLEVIDPDRSDIGDSIDRGLVLVRVLKDNGFCLCKIPKEEIGEKYENN